MGRSDFLLQEFEKEITMGTQAVDSKTADAASTAAQANDSVLTANAQQNQSFANNSRSSLFGTYNPATGGFSGGSESAFLNPNSLDQTGLTGTYANQYNNQANAVNQNTQQSVGTTMQNLASRGLGATPAGFAADQERQAYQTGASTLGNDYATALSGEHAEALNHFNNANSMLANEGTGAQSSALAAQGTAASNNASLYGTGEQQTQSPLGTALGFVGQLAAGSGAAAITKCWVAAEIFGGWYEPRTVLCREYLFTHVIKSFIGSKICDLYTKYGERLAEGIRHSQVLRAVFTPIFNLILNRAQAWKARG
jgi:hypothetical protein